MGDQFVKDFFDLDMKEKMQLIESRKKIEKELVRMVYAPVLMMYTSRLERQYNRDLNGIVSAAKEDIQVVGKQIDQSVTGQFAKSVKTTLIEFLVRRKYLDLHPDFLTKSKNLCKKVLTRFLFYIIIIYVNK